MIWLSWRQFRAQAIVAIGALAAFALLIILTGEHLRDVHDASQLGGCTASGGCTQAAVSAFVGREPVLRQLRGPALLLLPALLGMFWGAPLLARELETGTHGLVWTQSVTRTRWLAVKATLVSLAALAVAGLSSWLVSWWFAPLDRVNMDRFDPSVFTERGIVAVGYAGFAFAVGLAAGALLRRTLPAMAVTLVTFVAARIAFTLWMRPNLLATAHATQPVGVAENTGVLATPHGVNLFAGSPTIPNAWVYSGKIVDSAGTPASAGRVHALLHAACPKIGTPQSVPVGAGSHVNASPAPGGLFASCMARLSGQLHVLVTYQPASHYWPLQELETGIFLAAALLLIGTTIWLVARRAT